jgi:beta-galactosidase
MRSPGPLLGSRLPHLAYGGDYYPEQWAPEVWTEDCRLMREAGVNLVTVGVFAWSRLEPQPGAFDFAWLDAVLALLHEAGIRVDLATATASPPPWLSHQHPEMLPVLADGVKLWPGGRQHYCPSSPAYREAAGRLVEALARRYAEHPALALWHVGNEFGCHVPACWCDVSAGAFRDWLGRRYGTLEELNRAWGTDFWSQRYSQWEEVLPPRRAPTWPNPSQQLDFHRFCSDALLECFDKEREILGQHSPDVPVTTNFMGFFKPLDYWTWAGREDVVSNDSYPDPSDPDSRIRAAMSGDLMRSLGRGRPWILMEQTSSRVNWRHRNVAKAPGQMRLWSYQALARGADGVMFFQWRQSRAGAEKFHSAMVPHGPLAASPVWEEVVGLGNELAELDAVCGSQVPAEVAIVVDWESWWALELPSKPSGDVTLLDQLEAYYRPLFAANITSDFVRPAQDLSAYRLVLVPNLYLVSDEAAANLASFVSTGGSLMMSFFSGIVDGTEQIRAGGYAAPFAELLGIRVDEFYPLGAGQSIEVSFGGGTRCDAELWSELVDARTAEVVARFVGGVVDGRPALTRNGFGRGNALYLATRLPGPVMAQVLGHACADAGVTPVAEVPEGVEAVSRTGPGGALLFLLNHSSRTVEVSVPPGWVQMLSDRAPAPARLSLAGGDVAILRDAGEPAGA